MKRRIIHLGNVGYCSKNETAAAKTKKYAKRFSNVAEFYGIDQEACNTEGLFQHIQTDFIDGLERFADDSIDIVSSDLAVGYYSNNGRPAAAGEDIRRQYTHAVLEQIKKKLKDKGKVHLSVTEGRSKDYVLEALAKNGFKDIACRKFRPNEYSRTFWTFAFSNLGLYQISAAKK